jgi:hypothetical protein
VIADLIAEEANIAYSMAGLSVVGRFASALEALLSLLDGETAGARWYRGEKA